MITENAACFILGETPIYGEKDFQRIIDEEGIGVNTVIEDLYHG